jgi:hypothetical protein
LHRKLGESPGQFRKSSSTGIRSLDCPARRESLNKLLYHGPSGILMMMKMTTTKKKNMMMMMMMMMISILLLP